MLRRPPVPEHELEHDLAHFGITQDATAADPDPSRRRTFRTVDGPIGSLSVAEAVNLARVLNRLERVRSAARRHVATAPVFRSKPIGFEGSAARLAQADAIASEDALIAAIAQAEGRQP